MTTLDVQSARSGRASLASRATGLMRSFNEAGVIVASDVHVARCLGLLGGSDDDMVLLGAALAVRAPRLGHTCVDLETIRRTADTDAETPVMLDDLPWPEPSQWAERLSASAIVGDDRPLHLEGTTLYLDRYWSDECQVAADLFARADAPAVAVDLRGVATRDRQASRGGHGSSAAPRIGGCRDEAARGGGRRPGDGQDHHGGTDPRTSRRAGARLCDQDAARRARCTDGQGRRPPRAVGARRGRSSRRGRIGATAPAVVCPAPPFTASWDSIRRAAPASGTTGLILCHTTS